jgi:hypothetical protein
MISHFGILFLSPPSPQYTLIQQDICLELIKFFIFKQLLKTQNDLKDCKTNSVRLLISEL